MHQLFGNMLRSSLERLHILALLRKCNLTDLGYISKSAMLETITWYHLIDNM